MKVPTIEPLEARIAPAVLTITPVESSKAEGSTVGSTTDFGFRITLDAAEPQDITVVAMLKDGTAKVGDGDFAAFTQTLTIPKGQTEYVFNVPIRQDTVIEADETFSVELSSPSANATIGGGTATATITNDDKPLVTVQAVDTALPEGSSATGTTDFRFDVKLNVAATEDVTVLLTLKDGTAKLEDGDFDAFATTVTIPAGQLSTQVSVPIKHDFLDEGNETFLVELSDPSSGALLGSIKQATVTITDDDPPTLSIDDVTVLEGAAGETTQLKFKVKLSGRANGPVTFDWRTEAGSATAGVDFTNIPLETVTIPEGETEIELIVNVNGDDLNEIDETVRGLISNARLGTAILQITDNSATGTIKNDELSVSLDGDVTVTEGNPQLDDKGNPVPNSPTVTNADYTLTLSEVSNYPVVVELEVVDGTAKRGSDFTLPSLFVTIPAGQTAANITIPIKIDTTFEGDETYQVRIKSVQNALVEGSDSVTTTILNDDAIPKLTVVSRTVSEGTGDTQVQVTVNLSHATGEDVTFDWSTLAGSATAGEDYTGVTNQTVTIPAGSLFATLVLDLSGDEVYEGDETLSIVLSDPSANAKFEGGSETGTITIDEREAVPTISIADASAAEGAGTLNFVVSLPNGQKASQDITFDWVAAFGTATAGVDYVATPSTVTIPAGESSITVSVNLLNDAVMEPDETFLVTIGNVTLGSGSTASTLPIADGQATGRIINDERQVTISAPTLVAEADGLEGEEPVTARYVISLTDAAGNPMVSDRPVTVTLQFDDEASSAEATDIQLPSNMTVTIPAGETSVNFDVRILGDVVFEGDETLTLKIADSTHASSRVGSATTTITDNEAAPKLIVGDAAVLEGANGVVVRKVKIQLSGKAEQDVTFDWSTADGTAEHGPGGDYTRNLAGTATIPAGATEVELEFALSGDTLDEGDEHFFINVTNAVLGDATPVEMATDAQAKVTIQNDDVVVRIAGSTLTEGTGEDPSNLIFNVSIPQAASHDVTVTFTVGAEGDTASKDDPNRDYVIPSSFTVTIPEGETLATISVAVIGDALSEATEAFTVTLTSATNAVIGVGSATGTIVDDDQAPTLSISDQTIVEGQSGTQVVNFTIALSEAAGRDITVLVTPTGGTASLGAGADFNAQPQTITIPAGELTFTFPVTVNGDVRYENNETFTVVLSAPSGASIVDGVATGTITNDDAVPTLTIVPDSRPEGNSGTSPTNFVFSLSEVSDVPVTFKVKTVDGTAVAGSDYTAKQQEFTIPAGQTTATFSVAVAGDTVFEQDETFSVQVEELQGATLTGSTTATIIDDDTATLSIADLAITEGNAGSKTVDVIVTLTKAASKDVQFTWAAANGTAESGPDFTPPTGSTITIPAGQTTAKITFTILGDDVDELDENFSVTISDAVLKDSQDSPLTITDGVADVKIINDEITLSVADVTRVEGHSGTVDMVFTVKLSKASNHAVSVMVATQDGTAVSTGDRADYVAEPGKVLTFAAGVTEMSVTIKVNGDLDFDGNDQFKLLLSGATNAAITDGEAVGTIVDDEARPVIGIVGDVTRLENADEAVTPGQTKFTFTVKLDRASDEEVKVVASTLAGTAAPGSDFTAIPNQTITFAPGETEKEVTVNVLNDTIWEADETFKLSLSNPQNGSIGIGKERTGTIQSDSGVTGGNDIKPKLKVTSQSVVEGNDGEKFLSFVVERTGVTQTDISFDFIAETDATDGDTAVAGVDYVYEMPEEPITMAANESTKTVMVKILGDSLNEKDETFTVRLDNLAGAEAESESATRAKGTILNDDVRVKFSQGVYMVGEGNAGQTDLVFTVQFDGDEGTSSQFDTTITYTLAPGSASSGTDYQNPSVLTLVIPANQTSGQIRIPILGDTTAEPNETFTVTLTGATNAELASDTTTATGTILNDDAGISISDAQVEEGGVNGTSQMTFTITLHDAANYPVTVHYATAGGTAASGTDFTSTQGDVTFVLGGPTTINVTVPIIGDASVEANEKFTMVLSNAIGASILDNSGTGTILDDDALHLTITDASLTEGQDGLANMVFTVTLVGAHPNDAVTVDYATLDGTAKSAGPLLDYLARNGTLTFAPGVSTQTISVPIVGDTWKEVSEAFSVKLSNARVGEKTTGITIDDDTGAGQIVDDGDTILGVFVNNAKAPEAGNLQFVIETTAPTTSAITLLASTVPGTAGAADFAAVNDRTFTIAAGQSTATVTVSLTNDTVFEQPEYLLLEVSGFGDQVVPVDGSGGRLLAQGVILNDDINIINAREFQYVDKDGDLVHVKFSKGTLSIPTSGAGSSRNDISFDLDSTLGGRSLKLINLTDDGKEFEGANIKITAQPQILVTGEVLGDGKANVGAIEALVLGDNIGTISSGIGLGSIKIDGNLDRILSGSFTRILGVRSLEVESLGALTSSTSVSSSVVFGPIGKLIVHGDMLGSLNVVGDAPDQPFPGGIGKIGKLVIEGELRGGSANGSGQIAFTHSIGTAIIGGIKGGAGDGSALIVSISNAFSTKIGKLSILGDVEGGAGDDSGGILGMTKIGSLSIGKFGTGGHDIAGSLIGGAGERSGRITAGVIGKVTINGDIQGGGKDSGQLSVATAIASARIGGDIAGGTGESSGVLVTGVIKGKLAIEGNVVGGDGRQSGLVSVSGFTRNFLPVDGSVGSIVVGKAGVDDTGSLIGGNGDNSGKIFLDGNLKSFLAHGDFIATDARGAGVASLDLGGTLGTAVIKGSILGGNSHTTTTTNRPIGSAFVSANKIGNLTVEGKLQSGTETTRSNAFSGGIHSNSSIGSLKILGEGDGPAIDGNKDVPVVISAITKIGKLRVGGDVQYAEILAGYNRTTDLTKSRGVLLNAGATINSVVVDGKWEASSLVAGVFAGGDGKFGTADDTGASNGAGSVPVNQNLISRIASVVIKSTVELPVDAPANASYAIVAEHLRSVTKGGLRESLTAGASNDDLESTAPASKLQVFEI